MSTLVGNQPVCDEPDYPVINANPTFFAILRNWQLWDYVRLVGGTATGAAWGFMAGEFLHWLSAVAAAALPA